MSGATAPGAAADSQPGARDGREHLLWVLALATFVIFFQAFMVAPIIPQLSAAFGASAERVGLIVPAYLIPYGIATLAYGLLADRIGIRPLMVASLAAFAVLTGLTATAHSVAALAMWRMLTDLGASGVVPLALVLVGGMFSYVQRGRPLGWLFGAWFKKCHFQVTPEIDRFLIYSAHARIRKSLGEMTRRLSDWSF